MFSIPAAAGTDHTAPGTSIVTGPTGAINIPTATFGFSATELGSSFLCSLDNAAFTACSAPTYTGLGNGPHVLQVKAKDVQGNIDASPAVRSWTVDLLPPDTAITSGPSGFLRSRSATFEFSATEPGSFLCKIDAAALAPCPATKTFTGLSQGATPSRHKESTRRAMSTLRPRPGRSRSDTVAPNTRITSAKLVRARGIFKFASEAGAKHFCSLNGSRFKPRCPAWSGAPPTAAEFHINPLGNSVPAA